MENFDKTMKFSYEEIPKEDVKSVLQNVHRTLEERGYNAVNQIVGYLLSGDPAYIPRQNEARNQNTSYRPWCNYGRTRFKLFKRV